MSQNPDTRPLPDGWISEFSPQYGAWYYVNTKDANPQAVWTHPADSNLPPTGGSAQPAYPGQAREGGQQPPATGGDPPNPDTRPLPDGWIQQYDASHEKFFYVNTKHADPGSTVTWTHPAGDYPASASPAPAAGSTPAPVPPEVSSAPHSTHSPAPGATTGPVNPDTRPLPAGWVSKYDENYKAWYYVDTTKPDGPSSWEHPAGKSEPVHPGSTPSPSVGGAGAPENPDKRPLPPGWITQFDQNYGAWYYVKVDEATPVTIWEHPAGKADSVHSRPSTTAPDHSIVTPVQGGPHPTGTPGPENPDKRPLPPGWITQFDQTHKAWFYVKTDANPPVTVWEHPAGKADTSITPQPYGSNPHAAPAHYGGGTPSSSSGGGKGLEGLLGGSAGKMVGGLLGSKAKTQIDSLANKLGSQINKPSHGSHSQPGSYGAPPPGHGTPGVASPYGAPPPGHGPPGQQGAYPGQPGGYPGQQGGYPGQQGGYPGQQGGYPGQQPPPPPQHGQSNQFSFAGHSLPFGQSHGGGSHGSGGGAMGGLGDIGKLAGKFGFGKK